MTRGHFSMFIAGILAATAFIGAATNAQIPVLDPLGEKVGQARALAALAAGDPSSFAETVAIVQAATLAQAEIAGLSLPGLPASTSHATPVAAVATLAARHGIAVPEGTSARLAQVEGPMAVALTGVVDAFVAFEAAGDRASVMVARNALLEAVLALHDALAAGGQLPSIELAPALLVQGSQACVDDTYTQDVALLIDACGNDVYHNNAGGAYLSAAALYDHTGDDLYDGPNTIGGANGGGHDGSGFLVDREGDDVYLGYDDGVNGGGFGKGVGFLLDAAGDDRYDTGDWGWGTNGGGYFGGTGMLVDRSGHDVYRGSFAAVNGGSTTGDGFLYDGAGNDLYEAEFLGVNGGSSRGTGRLIDVAGDDRYVATLGGVNGGARDADALLRDTAGRDIYEDQEGGSGIDITVMPKGNNGAQMDE